MENNQATLKQIIGVLIFSIAMGYLETTVVVYLRGIFYPHGFQFPLVHIPNKILFIELFRESATLIMLVWIGLLSGHTKYQRFSFFLMAFGIWDIFYYVFLWVTLGWPATLSTWDILFLLPVPWVGPVWAPCILSLTMIFFAGMILWQEKRNQHYSLPFRHIIYLIIGSLVVISSFCIDPIQHLQQFSANSTTGYYPTNYQWWIFIVGELIIIAGIVQIYSLNKTEASN